MINPFPKSALKSARSPVHGAEYARLARIGKKDFSGEARIAHRR